VQLLSHYKGLDFYSSDAWDPPDTVGAAGPTSYIETVNATVAIFTPKDTGASSVRDSVFHFFYVTGGLPQEFGFRTAYSGVNSRRQSRASDAFGIPESLP
jgi:hypothetical protein